MTAAEPMVRCTECGRSVARRDSYLSGDGATCVQCFNHAQVAELGRLALVERGVPADAQVQTGEVRHCPKCNESTMAVTHTVHHTTRYFGGLLSRYSGREDTFTCVSCGHDAKIDSVGRFLRGVVGCSVASSILVFGCLSELKDGLTFWTGAGIALGAALLLVALHAIVTRVRHPVSRT